MWPMPEPAQRHTRAHSSWMRVVLVVVALVATALAIGLTRHHTDGPTSHEASALTAPALLGAVSTTDVGADAADLILNVAEGALAVCVLIVLCCIAIGARGFSLLRRSSASPPVRPVLRVPARHLDVLALAPSLSSLSISRT